MVGQPLAERGAWSLLLSLAQECNAYGYIAKGNGGPMSIEDMTNCLHITKTSDYNSFNSMLTKMEQQGSLSWNDGCLFITNFTERQELAASETKEAARDRQQRHRAKLREESRESRDADPSPLTIPEVLAKEIRASLMALPETIDYLVEHELIKETLAEMAKTKGLIPKSEVTTELGRIDLLWQDLKGNPVAGFEIDVFSPKKKSLVKLRALDCPYNFVILRSNPQPLHWEQDILLIGLSKERESLKEKEYLEGDIEGEGEGEGHGVTSVTLSPKNQQLATGVTENSLHAKIFLHWTAQKVVLHKTLTGKMSTALRGALKTYTEEEICQAITNYAEIVHGAEYRWTYKWTLEDFLRRGLEKFMDGEVARSNYRVEGGFSGKTEVGSASHRGDPKGLKAPTREQYRSSIGQ